MKKLLLLLIAVLASVGVNAATFTWTSDDGQYTVTASNVNKTGSDTYQKLEVNKEGALAAFVEATKDLSDPDGGPLKGVGGNSQRVNLIVEGPMDADDFTAMNSSTVSRWGTFTSVDLSAATIADFGQLAGMSMSGMKYLQLPGNLKSTESMATLKAKNAALDIVISGDKTTNPAVPEVTVYSFTANSIGGAITAFRESYGDFTNLQNAKKITMTGEYGDKDLQDNGKVFKNNPAIWDFTGSHFADCTIAAPGISYKNYDDPYEEQENVSPTNSSNAFYYFGAYATTVVDIKLPDKNMTLLPTRCLSDLGSSNKANYQLIYGTSDSEFNEAFGEEKTVKKYYESGTDTEFTGEKYQDNGAWKGRKENPCVVDLNTPPTESQVYTINGQTYPVGDLTVTNGQVTPAEYPVKLDNVSWYTDAACTQQTWYPLPSGRDEGGYYWYVNGDQNNKQYLTVYPKATYQGQEYTGDITFASDGNYGTIQNTNNQSFPVSTTYTYTYVDCNGATKTYSSQNSNETTYTDPDSKNITIIDLDERDVTEYGVASYAPLEELVIPNCYETLDFECGKWAHMKKLVVGSGTKYVQGGAFLKCDELEELDFVSGINNCYLGAEAFNECKSMKHIALSEGIVSLGARCFNNSQHLESIRLPETLIDMGNQCFDNCLALNSITIPSNVNKIGKKAFNLCPFTDVYLTTTDPDKIPIVWSCGTSFNNYDGNCSFNHGHLDGWEGLPASYQDKVNIQQYDWEHAAEWYYKHCNGIPVLHYPTELALKVRARISSTYHAKSTDGYGLPMQQDMMKRSNVNGADLGTSGTGKYSRDGWAQFMLMQEYIPDGESIVYTKEYADLWYTMCFPFDLTDEQLEAAFNKGYNIVDFSGVEIKKPEETAENKKTLILHFNTVAETFYKDFEDNLYERKTDGSGNVIREQHGNFSYNVYTRGGQEYHHVHASEKLVSNKTKTFAPGNSLEEATAAMNANKDVVVMIDGILATAGHPYMIHPAVGVSLGQPKVACNLSGITWKPAEERASIYQREERTIDLGEAKTNNNFNQAAYSAYNGQQYTFKGNWREYNDGWEEDSEIGPEPTFDMEMPKKRVRPTSQPIQPNFPDPGQQEPQPTTYNPVEDLTTYPAAFQNLYNKQFDEYFTITIDGVEERYGPSQVWYDATYGDIIKLADYTMAMNIQKMKESLAAYFGHGVGETTQAQYDELRAKVQAFSDAYDLYFSFQQVHNDWEAWRIYEQELADWNNWDENQVEREFQAEMGAYQTALQTWQIDHAMWAEKMTTYNVLIPKNAYFLGRKVVNGVEEYPKYYREIADDSTPRTTGLWTQYTAIVMPNAAAVAGIEAEIDGKKASANGFNMVIDEDFLGEETTVNAIEKIVAEAEEKGQSVEYMKVVYNINGQVVREGDTSLDGLPKGIYIVNGKKYFVR